MENVASDLDLDGWARFRQPEVAEEASQMKNQSEQRMKLGKHSNIAKSTSGPQPKLPAVELRKAKMGHVTFCSLFDVYWGVGRDFGAEELNELGENTGKTSLLVQF